MVLQYMIVKTLQLTLSKKDVILITILMVKIAKYHVLEKFVRN